MKFLNHIRSRSKLKNEVPEASIYDFRNPLPPARYGVRHAPLKLPDKVLCNILANVCPHVQDDTYIRLEDSMQDGNCMLCDLRELAQCTLVSRQWAVVGQQLLSVPTIRCYCSFIDYCLS